VPDQPKMNQTISLHANVVSRAGEPLSRGDVSARITAPSGKARMVHFLSAGDEWGEFTGRFPADEPGKHQVRLVCKDTGATREAPLFVQGAAGERAGRPARPDVLEEIARVTRGKVVAAGNPEDAVQSLAELPDPPPSVRRVQLWSHPAVAGGMI